MSLTSPTSLFPDNIRSFTRAPDKRLLRDNFFLFLIETICCDPSSGPSHRDGSDEGSQHMFISRTNKNYPLLSSNTPSYLELCLQ